VTGRLASRWAACAAVVAVALVCAGAAHAALTLGFMDQEALVQGTPSANGVWYDRARSVGARVVRLNVIWPVIAPFAPPDPTQAQNPSWSRYYFTEMDAAVRAARARGLRVLITVTYAPTWAEGSDAPPGAPYGAWKPDPTQLGYFATALARRYSGAFRDPLDRRRMLPQVDSFQGWNEPNLTHYLAPQWSTQNGQLVNVAAPWYRRMLNAFYAGIKQVQPAATIVAAGMSPYGDYPLGGSRTPPAVFWRDVLCLQGDLSATACPDPAHFDVVDSHPYDIKGPLHAAVLWGDLTLPDIGKLRRIVLAAQRQQTVVPAANKQYWVTEFSWDSNPPDPGGVSVQLQAHWLEEAFEVLWSQGVNMIAWYKVGDAPPIPSYSTTYQSGVFLLNGAAKPAATAFRFPFVVRCPKPGNRNAIVSCLAWGKSPARKVLIERLVGGRWRHLLMPRESPDGVFAARLRLSQGAILRAVALSSARSAAPSELSLNWRVNPLGDGL